MKEQTEERLKQLREEYKKGQEMLTQKQEEAAQLQQQLLRIDGAIQVLEELLNTPLESAREERSTSMRPGGD